MQQSSSRLDKQRVQRSQGQGQARPAPPKPQLGATGQHRERLLHIPLPHRRRPLLSLHMRQVVPAQARLHLPLRPLLRVPADVPGTTVPLAVMSAVRLRRVRYLHPAHKEDIPGLESHAEPGQAQRRAEGRHKGHDQEHRGPAIPRRQPGAHGRHLEPITGGQQKVQEGGGAHQLGVAIEAGMC